MAILTSKEVCEILGIKPNNLYQINYRKGLVSCKKEGKQSFYLSEDVETYKIKRNERKNK